MIAAGQRFRFQPLALPWPDEGLRPVDLAVDGAASLKAAVIPVVLHYSTADPLG